MTGQASGNTVVRKTVGGTRLPGRRDSKCRAPVASPVGPFTSRSLAFPSSLYIPFLRLSRARQWAAGTSEMPVTAAHLAFPPCRSRAPTPASIPPLARGGPVLVVAQQNGGGSAAWALGLQLGLIFPICEPRGLRPGSVRTCGSVISGVVLAAGTEGILSTISGFHEEHVT